MSADVIYLPALQAARRQRGEALADACDDANRIAEILASASAVDRLSDVAAEALRAGVHGMLLIAQGKI